MSVTYRDDVRPGAKELEDLFLSVHWSSGHFPEKLEVAMRHFETVVTAWDEGRLVGLVSAMDDSVMTAYIHYLLVRPEYQDRHIGRELLRRTTAKYKDYLRIVVIGVNEEVEFYKNCGFTVGEGKTPLFITSLWT